MQVKFAPYQKRDGKMMLFVNGSNGVSVGISENQEFSPYGKNSTPETEDM